MDTSRLCKQAIPEGYVLHRRVAAAFALYLCILHICYYMYGEG